MSLPITILSAVPAIRMLRMLLFAAVLSVPLFLLTRTSHGQYQESFDSRSPVVHLYQTDCDGPTETWQRKRAVDPDDDGNRYEKVHFETGTGSTVLAAIDVPPAYVIPELKFSARIRATRPGVQILARVVLPGTASPDNTGPMKLTIPGPVYRNAGKWQTLHIEAGSDFEEKLREQTWLLRQRHDMRVDVANAFVDKLVLNLYTSPGDVDVDIDDIRMDSMVGAQRIAAASIGYVTPFPDPQSDAEPLLPNQPIHDPGVRPARAQQTTEKQPAIAVREGSVLLVRDTPFFPKIIQYNDEPLIYLKSLGFNTVELPATASPTLLREAADLDMWIICPAPPSAGLDPIGFEYDRVIAWTTGHGATGKHLQNIQNRIREIRTSDMREGRPVIAGVDAEWRLYGQEADILAVGVEPLGTSFIASTYSNWLNDRSLSTGSTRPIWAAVQTEISETVTRQVAAVAPGVPPLPVEPQQMKFLTYEAIAGGARGLRFTSRKRLDLPDPVTRLRALTIQWTLRHVDQLEPWAVGGAVMGQLDLDENHLEVTALNTNRSRLLLVQRPTHHEQYWAGDTPLQTIRFRDVGSAFSGQAFMINDDGLVPLSGLRNHDGTTINIEGCPYCTAIVMTQDPLVINRLRHSYDNIVGRESLLQMRVELTRQWMAIMQLIDTSMGRMGRSPANAGAALNEAMSAWRKASELLTGNSPATCMEFLNRADERLSLARRELVTQPLGRFQSKTSTPLLSHVSLVPLHWQISDRLAQSSWNPNGLAAGDFEDLDHMMRNDWQNRRLVSDEVTTKVELSEEAAVDGDYGLKMTVQPHDQYRGIMQSTPVWITSGKVSVRQGQMVRIHGWVNVPETITGSHHGLMITESIGGPQLAERIPMTQGWEEITLYRSVPADTDLEIKIELTGVGTAMIDELTVRTIDLPPGSRQAMNR